MTICDRDGESNLLHCCLRCECHGKAQRARYIPKNETHNGTCVCECEATTFTEGEKVRY
jgi:hypothetical protein